MKKLIRLCVVLVSLAFLTSFAYAAEPSALAMSTWLEGEYKGVTSGNELRVRFRRLLSDTSRGYDHSVPISGSYQRTNIRLSGLLRLEGQGSAIQATYIPHFDVAAPEIGPEAQRFTRRELEAACNVDLAPSGDGFVGDTLESRCAFAIRGAVGKWEVFFEPGTIRVRHKKSGETLRFKKIEAK